MNAPEKTPSPMDRYGDLPQPPVFATAAEERLHRKQRLAASFRIFSKFGFDEGVAGHITARDPEFADTFWVNPFGVHFSQVKVSNLIRVNHKGEVVEGDHLVNAAAFAIHSRIHAEHPEVNAAAHSHGLYGKTWSALGRKLDPITQDACAFFGDHVVIDGYSGVVVELDEGTRIAKALGANKGAILKNHGLLTVGASVDEAVWWYVSMERCCQSQLLAEAVARPGIIPDAVAAQTHEVVGSQQSGWFQFQTLYARVLKEQPDFLD